MSNDGLKLNQAQLDASVLEQLAIDMDESILPTVLAMFLADGQELITQVELTLASGDDEALANKIR
jgi:hypothetical protein